MTGPFHPPGLAAKSQPQRRRGPASIADRTGPARSGRSHPVPVREPEAESGAACPRVTTPARRAARQVRAWHTSLPNGAITLQYIERDSVSRFVVRVLTLERPW